MKQYLLLFKSGDFTKTFDEETGNYLWTSNPINLYNNSQYSNYSYTRSRYGLNLIGDNTYVGTEVTSPSYSGGMSTPLSSNAVYVTNAGEIVYEPSTPDLIRFLDTSSRIDILAYKHAFTNLSGFETPSFNLQMHESDTEDGPWLKSSLSFDSNIIFITNSKPWVKIELEILTDNVDTSTLGLLFYLEIGIHEPTSPVASTSARNILRRFPTWTKLFEDSVQPATPSLATPQSTGGKFLTALVQESIDSIVSEIDLRDINAYINSADENMLAWAYISYDIPTNLQTVVGDGIRVSPVNSLADFHGSRIIDHVYYYNPIDKQLLVMREYVSLSITGSTHEQYPANIFNNFDEFGARLGLQRLYKETNSIYKKRILDVSQNIPGIHSDGLKRTLRRELDIWKVYGATPDSDSTEAFPSIYEISDLEKTTPYFTPSGKPQKPFKDLVKDLNTRYPSNIGYVRWNEGTWDYSGIEGEGVSRIPAIYDVGTSPLSQYYQPGIGDFSDGRFIYELLEKSTISFDGSMSISGVHKTGRDYAYTPIVVDYSWYTNYLRTLPDYNAGRRKSGVAQDVGVGLTYEIVMPPHANYATPSTFYANLNYTNREDFYVGNRLPATSSASPEFNYIRIFDQEGDTISSITFRDKVYNQIYLNTHASPITNSIHFYDASSVKITFSNGGWNYASQAYDTSLVMADYRASFATSTPNYYTNPAANSNTSMTTPNRESRDGDIKIGSTNYSTMISSLYTSPVQSNLVLNAENDPTISGISTKSIYINEMIDRVILPFDATPQYLYVNVSTPNGIGYFGSENIQTGVIGGTTYDPYDNSAYLIPSSPNISWRPFNSSNSSLGSASYFNSATINYASTPHYMRVESATSNHYPIYFDKYEAFTAQTTPNLFTGYIDSLDNVYKNNENPLNSYFNSDSFLDTIYLNKNSFGLTKNDVYIIKDAALNTGQDEVEAYVESRDKLLSDLNSSLSQEIQASVNIYAKKDKFLIQQQGSGLHTGWVYVNENDHYIYANPVTDSSTGRFFSMNISNTPRSGAPVLVNVQNKQYSNVAFEDAATPGKLTFRNSEITNAKSDEMIYLAYKDITDVSIVDNYTGIQILDTINVNGNQVGLDSAATPLVHDREYLVSYKVNNAWYLDNEVYDSPTDSYKSVIYFSATPSTNSIYNVTYENSINDISYPIDLSLDSSLNPIDEGFIYISKEDYPFSHVEAHLSPAYISDSVSDLMYLSLVSHDDQYNLKPGQTFSISGDLISATPSFVTTSNNGMATSIIRYKGVIPAVYRKGQINITGIGSATPNGGQNSSSQGYSLGVPFEINRNDPFNLSVKVAASDLIVNADGISKISISGKMYWKNKPFNNQVQLSWNKARTLKDLFAATPDYTVNTNSSGEFTISNAITASNLGTPGYWFARVNVSNPETVRSTLAANGEVLSSNDVTISGDVIYWYESYDSIQYSDENDIPLPNAYTANKQKNSQIIATPNFAYSHSDAEIVYTYNSTPNWLPPKWVPLSRYDQYQMGLLGATPYYISDYSKLHPDHEEE